MVSIKLLMLVLQNMSVACTTVLMLLMLTKDMVSEECRFQYQCFCRQCLLVNMRAIMWGKVLNDVSGHLE
jgi:hypothetical protein